MIIKNLPVNCNGKLIETLQNVLGQDLSFFTNPPTDGKRLASVLVPLICVQGEWQLLFIRRTSDLLTHKGEVAFPGGGVEDADNDFGDTALRETWEEIGIDRSHIKIIGTVKRYDTISNYTLVPVVGNVDWPAKVIQNPEEVAAVFSIPLKWLSDSTNWDESEWISPSGEKKKVIHFHLYGGEHLWGVTARIVLDLIEFLL